MTFNDFVQKDNSKSKATSNIKIQQALSSFGLDNVRNNLSDGPFSSDIGIVKLHPSKGTHWVVSINEKYFDSYACPPPKNLYRLIRKRKKNKIFFQNTRYKV